MTRAELARVLRMAADKIEHDDLDGIYAREIVAVPAMVALLQRVADHFEDTDAPLGVEARALLARIEGA